MMMRAPFLCLLLMAVVSSIRFAEGAVLPRDKSTYPAQHFSLAGVREIKIIGVRGHLKMTGRRQARLLSLKVQHSNHRRYDDWQLSVDRRGRTLYLEVINILYGREWRSQVREEKWPEFDIEIEGPARATTVSWREGQLEIVNWSATLDISFLRGESRIQGGHGDLKIQPVEAQVLVSDRVGALSIQGQSGRVQLESTSGSVDVNWLKGPIVLRACQGKMRLAAHSGDLEVLGGKGELHAKLDQGQARILDFAGAIVALGEESNWFVRAQAPSDLNVTSERGEVQVKWAGAAKVFLTSTAGAIAASPSDFLQSSERDGQKIMQGFKSGKSMGQVFVKTRSGGIVWR